MKILLIMPDANIHKLEIGPICASFREAPLTLTTLAALVPAELNATIKIIDESVENILFDNSFDLVGISCLTGTANRAYEIADMFRRLGVTVVLGGVHVALRPYEACKHADSLVIGFAEQTWPQLLRDFAQGRLNEIYYNNSIEITGLPVPRRDLQKRFGYMSPNTVFATRGCKSTCDFCTIPVMPFKWQTRPVNEVIKEIQQIKAKRIVFNDVSLLEDRDYAKELFTAMIPLKKVWGGLCTTNIGKDDEMLELMSRSGCIYLLIGFESVSKQALHSIHKGFNRPHDYCNLMEKLHNYNIIVQGCFIFGFDHDSKDVFEQTVQAVNKLKIDIPRYAIYTPYPGTKAFKRLKKEGRILHENWEHYDTQHVVFQPAQMTPVELDNGFRKAYKETFSVSSILNRTLGSGKNFPITAIGNLAYKMYIRRLQTDMDLVS